jgi:hypothetical protein
MNGISAHRPGADQGAPDDLSQDPAAAASRDDDRVPRLVWLIAAVFSAVELALSGLYGFQQDELYFLMAGHHLAFGYVDQPPLIPLLTRVTGITGVSPTAVRVIPAPAGGRVRGGPVRPGARRPGHGVRRFSSPPHTSAIRPCRSCLPGRWSCCVSARHCCGTGGAGGWAGALRPVPGSRPTT